MIPPGLLEQEMSPERYIPIPEELLSIYRLWRPTPLHRARRLMLAEDLDAAAAAHRVGYESASQFSREYRRLFGAPPAAERNRLRDLVVDAQDGG